MKSKRTEEVAYLSTAMATRVKTDADTEMPCTVPLSLHTRLPKGHPAHRKRQTAVSTRRRKAPECQTRGSES